MPPGVAGHVVHPPLSLRRGSREGRHAPRSSKNKRGGRRHAAKRRGERCPLSHFSVDDSAFPPLLGCLEPTSGRGAVTAWRALGVICLVAPDWCLRRRSPTRFGAASASAGGAREGSREGACSLFRCHRGRHWGGVGGPMGGRQPRCTLSYSGRHAACRRGLRASPRSLTAKPANVAAQPAAALLV